MARDLSTAASVQRACRAVVNATASGGIATASELNALDVSCRRWLDSREGDAQRASSETPASDDAWLGTGNPTRTATGR